MWSCGGDSDVLTDGKAITQSQKEQQNKPVDLNVDTASTLADDFCANQKNLQFLSASLQGAFSVKGNGSFTNYCGGEITLAEVGDNFEINITDYCVNARGQDVLLNGSIFGAIESGADFTSEISSLTIVGEGIDLAISGLTWDGRADDMFIALTIIDNLSGDEVLIDEVSIKKGELDLGYITFADLGRFEFKFIKHFNAELTEGQLFFYGGNEEIVIISADNSTITVVHKDSKLDSGVLVESTCGG